MLRLNLFGGAMVLDESGALAALSARRHPLALLALLAVSPSRMLTRGKLVGYLWPEVREKTARNRLTSCLYQVRSAAGSEAILSVGDDLSVNPDVLQCDIWRFKAALDAQDYTAAIALYGGPFLDGFWLRCSAAFEQRVERERDRLRGEYHAALEALAALAEEQGDRGAAAQWWRERAADDPYDSRIAGRLVAAVAATGNRPGALRIARKHRTFIEAELGGQLDAEFQAVVATVERPARAPEGTRTSGSDSAAELPAAESGAVDLPVTKIAVLPFENLSGTAEAEPFAVGLHDDLLTELSRVPALTVISRTSVLRYRGTTQSVEKVARELGVGTLVEGGVQSAGGRLRLNVQLIDARSGAHRWVERYDRELSTSSLFDIQSELATKIARALEAELTAPSGPTAEAEPAGDLEAYRLCIQGRVLLDQRTPHELYRAIEYFQRALHRRPVYALAWSGLADALSLLEFYDYVPPTATPDPRDAALRALELDPRAGQTHASFGIISSIRQEGTAAVRALERAVELAPSYADAHVWLGWVHLLRGAPAAALISSTRSVELDPLAPALRAYLAECHLAAGNPTEALREANRARELRPAYGLAFYMQGLVLYHLGRAREAEDALRGTLVLVPRWGTPSHAEVHAMIAVIRAGAGDEIGARELLSKIIESAHSFSAGLVHAALGDADAAFAAFDQVGRWDSFSTEHFRYFFPAVLGPLRTDARYRRILRNVDRAWNN